MEPKCELQRNCIAKQRRQELEIYQRALDIQWINNRMEDSRMGRTLAQIKQENNMEREFKQRTDLPALVNKRAETVAKLATEVGKVRDEETCKLLRRHLLWERTPELRTTISKMKAGYVCRDLKQQIQNNEYKKLQEKMKEIQIARELRNALESEEDVFNRTEITKLQTAHKFREGLNKQMEMLEQKRRQDLVEKMLDKKMIDESLQKIKDEDQRALELKLAKKEMTRVEMSNSMKERAAHMEKMRQLAEEEAREVARQAAQLSDRNAAVVAARNAQVRQREEIGRKIAQKILDDEAEQNRRDAIIKLLQEQEYLEKNVQDDIAEQSTNDVNKNNTKIALTKQMEEKRNEIERQKRRDLDLRLQNEAKVAADNQKEFEKQMAKRQKNLAYCAELKKQIADNEMKRRQDRELEDRRNKSVFDFYKGMDAEVAEERKKLMEEHAPHLLGYLQAGVLLKDDLPSVRKGADKDPELAKLEIEKMGISTKERPVQKCNAQCKVIREW